LQWRIWFRSSNPPPTSRKFDKVKPDCKVSGKCLVFHSNILISLKNAEFRTPTPQPTPLGTPLPTVSLMKIRARLLPVS